MKIFKVVVAAFLLFTIIPIQHVSAIDEITKPTVEHLAVDKKQVTTGEVVYINLGVTSNSDYRYAILYYSSPITSKGITIRLTYNEQTQLFEGNFPVEEYVESGIYTPNMISLYNDRITTIYSHEYDGFELGSFEVKDTAGIEFIQSINVDKNDVELGDTVNIQVQTSSFEQVRYMNAYFISPVTNQMLTVPLYYNDETANFEGEIPITGIMENGVYTLDMMNTYEYGGNTTAFYSRYYNGLFDNGNFSVSGMDIENLVEDISINKSYVTVGEKMNFTVKLTNAVGINYLNLNYTSPRTGYSFNVDLYVNSETGLFEGSFTPSLNFEEGTYPLDFIAIYSSMGTSTALYEDIDEYRDGDFTFYREQNPPTFNSISLNKKDLEPGELVKVYVSADDDTLLSEAVVNFISPLTQTTMPIHLQYDEIQNQFIGEFYAENSAEIGNWIVDTIEIKDTNQNTTLVSKEDTDLNAGTFTIKDVIKPEIYSVNQITDQTTIISGTAEAKSIITASNQETEIGSIETDSSSEFYLPIEKQKAGTKITLTAEDAAGNVSETKEITVIDVTAPQAPSVNKVTDQSTIVTGTGEIATEISVKVASQEIGTVKAGVDGKFSVTIPKQLAGTELVVTARDASGNTSEATKTTVLDVTAPSVPIVNKITDQSTVVTGKAEASSKVEVRNNSVVIGQAKATSEGTFSITIPKQVGNTKLTVVAIDTASNSSLPVEVLVVDTLAPAKPTVNEVSDVSVSVSGQAEPNAKIEISKNNTILASGTASAQGSFTISIAKQLTGTSLGITAIDAAGNRSEMVTIQVVDKTVPTISEITAVTSSSTKLSGKTEAGATVTLSKGGDEIGSATANQSGAFTLTFAAQAPQTELSLVAWDAVGNVSPTIKVVVAAQKEYEHLASSHWAYKQVMYLADASIIGGYPDGTFQPNRQTTRAEAARMLASALNLEVVDTPSIFKDVASSHWANDYIVAAAKAGVFKGNPDGTFNPAGKLTRAEMATLLSTAYDLTAKKPAHFSDVKATHWANQSIAAMYENNLTVGYPDGTYRPSNPTTRAEFSMFLAKALNKEFR
ncbi:Ig-like domain-containing protein [Chryseomicrobium excrementi]|nr:Ig-like domain-containing protein [Chryseomicrobium excrementi]